MKVISSLIKPNERRWELTWEMTGFTRLNRLQCIGGSSTHIGLDALRLGINEAKQGRNIEKYMDLIAVTKSVAPSDPLAVEDQEWIDSKTRQVKAETDRLEHELKGYKNNLIKESIRVRNPHPTHGGCG